MKSTVKEKPRLRSGLIVRGMMAGPVASSPEVISNIYKIFVSAMDFISNVLR